MAAGLLLRFNIWPSEFKQLFQHAASYFEGNIYNIYKIYTYIYFIYSIEKERVFI